jgi:hypothetical protein
MTAVLLLAMAAAVADLSTPARAADEAKTKAESEKFLTEREYLVEEVKLAEELLASERSLAAAGRGSSEKVINCQKNILSLKRQIVAYDGNHPRALSSEALEKRRQAAEEQKKKDQEASAQALTIRKELAARLIGIIETDKDPGVRKVALQSLVNQRLDDTMPFLHKLARDDKDMQMRQFAIRALGEYQAKSGVDLLLQLLDEIEDTSLKAQILNTSLAERAEVQRGDRVILESRVPERALPKLEKLARQSESVEVRRAAMAQMNTISGEAVSASFAKFFDTTKDQTLRQMIVDYLGRRGDRTAVDKLLEIAQKDEDPNFRQQAVRLLGGVSPNNLVPGGPTRMMGPPAAPPAGIPGLPVTR